MSKELEALERYGYHCSHYVNGKKDYKIIEAALKDYEKLKAQDKFVDEVWKSVDLPNYSKEAKENNKKIKALEIIIKKNVNVRAFKKVLLMKQNDDAKLRAYNSQNHRYEDDLTREEYDLLTEVLL